ncbi:MAG: chemotaxis protein [Bacteroidetes bacterium]|nr:chemotaxis protein [Bacteroidota bacterium]
MSVQQYSSIPFLFEVIFALICFKLKKMEVKGTAIKTTRDFIKTKFPEQYDAWFNALPAGSRTLYETALDATGWYPLNDSYTIPIRKVVEMFYKNDAKTGGEDLGKYSAEIALKGFYKVFLLVASPTFLIQRASKIFTTFYQPSKIEVEVVHSNAAILKILEFDGIDSALEYRIAGWVLKALELANCREPAYDIKSSLAKGDPETDILFNWK